MIMENTRNQNKLIGSPVVFNNFDISVTIFQKNLNYFLKQSKVQKLEKIIKSLDIFKYFLINT